MRVTRLAAAGAAGQSSSSTPRLINPTLAENWPPEPSTPTEFASWLALTKAALQKWLTEAAAAAQDPLIEATIRDYTEEADRRRQPFEHQTDVETGQMYDKTQRSAMKTAVEAERKRRADLHEQHKTWRKFAEHRYAQATWEDFLYYQNVWNRRNYIPAKIYSETAPGRRGAKIRQAFRDAMRPEGEASESDRNVVAKGKGKAAPKKKKYEYGLARDPTLGTTNQDKMDRTHVDWYDEPFFGFYRKWLDHMIALYTDARLGYRKRVPHVVAPEHVHRYTQPPRGTGPRAPRCNEKRCHHLEERFPRRKRVQIDVGEVEEMYRGKTQRGEDIRRERTGGMKMIGWRIDEGAYEKMKAEKDAESGFSANPRTLRLLPKEHKTHHGSWETSFNWPTSFDSPGWGNGVAVTAIKRDYAYDEVGDAETYLTEPKKKTRNVRYKLDENGQRIKKMDKRPRYKREGYVQEERIFEQDVLGGGMGVAGRDRNDRWIGSFVHGNISKERWELDEDGYRIPLVPQYVSNNKFATLIVKRSNMKDTRLERHSNRRTTNQLSDNEDNGCVDSNENFPWSGNMNPDQLGNPWASSDGSGDEDGVDRPTDSDDDESDDDGDLFSSSYKECSECPK